MLIQAYDRQEISKYIDWKWEIIVKFNGPRMFSLLTFKWKKGKLLSLQAISKMQITFKDKA
jgi:hypothetical protein